jgi:Flp pilus assembly CpaF family ATPase
MDNSDPNKKVWRAMFHDLEKHADKGREPEFLATTRGRQISINALIERVIQQFVAEHGERESPDSQQAITETERIKLVKESAEYVIAVESVTVTNSEKADIIRRVYAEMFGYGLLSKLFDDLTITTITLEGSEKVAIRRGHGELTTHTPLFDDENHYKRIIRRLLEDAGVKSGVEDPIIETGLTVNNRRISLNVIQPPASILITADIRLHPQQALTLNDLAKSWEIPQDAVALLQKIAQSSHGVIIVGEAESGKTTLLNALTLQTNQQIIAVERSGEMALPETVERLTVQWDNLNNGFSDLIQTAIQRQPDLIVLDEIRADETASIAPLLTEANIPRMFWTFRGAVDNKRLAVSLGMLARRASPAHGEDIVKALYQRLPFVITVRRRKKRLTLHSIAEWQFQDGQEYPDYIELMAQGWEGIESTGKPVKRTLS